MHRIKFIKNPETYSNFDSSVFVAHIKGVKDEKELFNQLNSELRFPYFGFNWDALDECLSDFHWMNESGIILVHDDLPTPEESVLKMYLNVLVYTMGILEKRGDHYLEVIFPEEFKESIEKYITENSFK
jgi:hypothetical protein